MAEHRQTAITPSRSERRTGLTRSTWDRGWGGSPFRTLQRMADDMDRVFEDFGFGRLPRPAWGETGAAMWAPEIDVFQKNNELTIRADLPGLKREEVSVDITDNEICIQGERKHERGEEREGYYRSERSFGSFCRVIQLPEGTITEQAKATFKDGVLTITLPKAAAARPRRIAIEAPKG